MEADRRFSSGSGFLHVLWRPEGIRPVSGQCQWPCCSEQIYVGHLCAPSLSPLLALFFSLLEEIAEGLMGHSSHLMRHTRVTASYLLPNQEGQLPTTRTLTPCLGFSILSLSLLPQMVYTFSGSTTHSTLFPVLNSPQVGRLWVVWDRNLLDTDQVDTGCLLKSCRGRGAAARMLNPAAETGMPGNVTEVVRLRERTGPGLHEGPPEKPLPGQQPLEGTRPLRD